jgi:hypothetical protein
LPAADAAYGHEGKSTDAERVAFLFEPYPKCPSLLPAGRPTTRRNKKGSGG